MMSLAEVLTARAGILVPSGTHSPASQSLTPAICRMAPYQASRCLPNVSSPYREQKMLHVTCSPLADSRVRCQAARAWSLS
jgi:hypothetical protein